MPKSNTNDIICELKDKIEKSNFGAQNKNLFSLLVTLFEGVIKDKDDNVVQLQRRVTELEEKVRVMETKVDQDDQYERRDTLAITGEAVPPEAPDQDPEKTAIHLNINIDLSNIDPSG